MKCKLCHQHGSLCRSHIIPEFLYLPLYDGDHRFIRVSDIERGKVSRGQKGEWERLLCRACESSLAEIESHCCEKFFRKPLSQPIQGSERIREHADVDAGKLKLFFLSILWRSSISSRPFFKNVRLGPHEEVVRQMLLRNEPGGVFDYPTLLRPLFQDGQHRQDVMVEPTPSRDDGRRFYRFVLMGYVAMIYVSMQRPNPKLEQILLKDGQVVRSFSGDLQEFRFLKKTWERVAQTTKDIVI